MRRTGMAIVVTSIFVWGACKSATLDARPEESSGPSGEKTAAVPANDSPKAVEKPATAAHPSVAGAWRSNFGPMTFTESGDAANATFPDGTMDCTWKKDDLVCTWQKQGGAHGKAKMWFLSSGELSGDWGNGISTGDGGRLYFAKPDAPKQDWESGSFGYVKASSGGGAKECSFSTDCPAGVTCSMNGKCATSAGGTCSADKDCGGGKCHSAHCSNGPDGRCSSNAECTGGAACNTITHKCGR